MSQLRNPHAEPRPTPAPGLITQVTYLGLAGPLDRRNRSFSFRIRISVDEDAPARPVLVEAIHQPFPSLTLHATPAPPLFVGPGTPRSTTLRIAVRTCSGVPRGVSLPALDITLRNSHRVQIMGCALGAAYAADLEGALTRLCPPSVPRSPQAP
ncbi:hypothetical protein [Streptomyces sp. NPDC051561]|uniref:hypothetical protein n=1 Tax=Streptomyces sp. NPDC051561 TaxID=3365658 RepID=UPI0037AB220C